MKRRLRALAVRLGVSLRQVSLRLQAWGLEQHDGEGLVSDATLRIRPDYRDDVVMFEIEAAAGDVTEVPLQPLKALGLAQQLLHAARDVDRFRRTPKAGSVH